MMFVQGFRIMFSVLAVATIFAVLTGDEIAQAKGGHGGHSGGQTGHNQRIRDMQGVLEASTVVI